MSFTRDMVATYRGPRRVIARHLAIGPREDRALAILMAGCAIIFVAQWPRLAREAHLSGQDLNPLLGGALMAWIFIMPLVLYALAMLSQLFFKLLRKPIPGYAARMALFWALLASTPLILLQGLVAGFIGAGAALSAVGFLWSVGFFWFWTAGLVTALKMNAKGQGA